MKSADIVTIDTGTLARGFATPRHVYHVTIMLQAHEFPGLAYHLVHIASEMLGRGPWRVRVCACTCARSSLYTGKNLGVRKFFSSYLIGGPKKVFALS